MKKPLIVLGVIALVGGLSWYSYNQNTPSTVSYNEVASTSSNQVAELLIDPTTISTNDVGTDEDLIWFKTYILSNDTPEDYEAEEKQTSNQDAVGVITGNQNQQSLEDIEDTETADASLNVLTQQEIIDRIQNISDDDIIDINMVSYIVGGWRACSFSDPMDENYIIFDEDANVWIKQIYNKYLHADFDLQEEGICLRLMYDHYYNEYTQEEGKNSDVEVLFGKPQDLPMSIESNNATVVIYDMFQQSRHQYIIGTITYQNGETDYILFTRG